MVEYYQKLRATYGPQSFKTTINLTNKLLPKELILDIASWVSIEFYDKCNNIIINYFVKEFKNMDGEALKQKIEEVEEQMEKLTLENEIKDNTICR